MFTVSYDGTDYRGWQYQPHERTIEGVLRASFYTIFHVKISIVSASRTDAGVHAYGQVARICTLLNVEAAIIQRAWNNGLPPDIVITSLWRSNKTIHPRKNVIQKTYWYHFCLERPLPFFTRFGWYFPYKFNIEQVRQYLNMFVGTHDFRSFCTGYEHDTTVRTIDSVTLSFHQEWRAFRITILGKSFLRHMIRRIIGAAFYVAYRNRTIDDLYSVMECKNSNNILPTAPAQGLLLYKIKYEKS